jgi:aldehyde dehydrogenase
MAVTRELVAEIAREVVARLEAQGHGLAPAPAPSEDGVFATVDDAVEAAAVAQERVAALSLAERGRIVTAIRNLCAARAPELARMELDESGLGRLDHKIAKLHNVRFVQGVEAMRTEARSDTSGLCVIERAPWGVIGMVLPATHSVPTMASNAINVISAGNTAVFSPHPAASKVAAYALKLFNREIERETGIANVLTTMREPSIKAAEELFEHPGVALLCVTGGPAVVRAAMRHNKRVIAAGPGNPPVVVDETADLDAAARSIIAGASFDNNLLCIGEKEVFVVAQVADAFLAAMRRAGAFELDAAAIERLALAAFAFDQKGSGCGAHLKRDLIGKDVAVLAAAAGVQVPSGTDLLFGETNEDHPFVQEEQMMPFLPIVRVRDRDAAILAALKAEHGYHHTALIHSRDVGTVTKMARALDTTLFVHNAPCSAALGGTEGPGYLSFSIATPTGEGITTPLTFTRERQIVVGRALRIV